MEKNDPKLEKFKKKIPGCSDVNSDDVEKWITEDEHELMMSDQEIVASVQHEESSLSLKDLQDDNEIKILPDQAYLALKTSLDFIERQPDVTAHEIMIFRKWRDAAAFQRFTATKKQTLLTDFFKKN